MGRWYGTRRCGRCGSARRSRHSVGVTFIGLLTQVAPNFALVAVHFPFAGAWSALALRTLRRERAWVDACDVTCVVLCLTALAMATFV